MPTIERIVARIEADAAPMASKGESLTARFLKFMCSVRLGLILLVLLGASCLTGMLVMQQNINGFDRYFDALTPAQRLVYGSLGFFDIYHTWYFNALLAILALNIILASVDRFPITWLFVTKPSVIVPVRWLREQRQTAEPKLNGSVDSIIEKTTEAMKTAGWRHVTTAEKDGRKYVFAQSGVWNRLGAYSVHISLLTILTGGFLTAQVGSTGQMSLRPGEATDLMTETLIELDQAREVTRKVPFVITCIDLQQRLIKKDGTLSAQNTIDWMTTFTITDETGTHEAFAQMNRPFDYRGYRFFQSSFTPVGRARSVMIRARPVNGGEEHTVTIPRNGSAELPDGTKIKFSEFRANFRMGPEDLNENTSDYKNPAAVLQVTQDGAAPQTAYAFGPQTGDIPAAGKPAAGHTFHLADFEKAADQHILSVQRDLGANVVYAGFVLLFLTLTGVFFFSHQRVWAVIERGEEGASVVLAGHANRNRNAFDEKFKRFVHNLENK